MVIERALRGDEIGLVWTIDRREVIENIYRLVDGELKLEPEYFDVHGWPPGETEKYTPLLVECYEDGGWFHGLFDEEKLVGLAVLENKLIGNPEDMLQLKFLHVGYGYRDQGWGRWLFESAKEEARRRGAKRMYISATPSEHTINFYLRLGCKVTREPDPELFALEPEDIHLEYNL